MKKFVFIFFITIINSCSDEELFNSKDYILNNTWQLKSYNLSVAVDLNLDGISSYDMVNEFPCLKNELFKFDNKNVQYYFSNFSFVTSVLGENGIDNIKRVECSIGPFSGFSLGTYKINNNTLELDIRRNALPTKFNPQFELIDDQLIRKYSTYFPVLYDINEEKYIVNKVDIELIFEPI